MLDNTDGRTIVATLPAGIRGRNGTNLRRFCLLLHRHESGHNTAADEFHANNAAVLHAGVVSAPFVTIDDTNGSHANRYFHITQIGGEHFTAFRTAQSKSRPNFLALLRGNYQDYVLNNAAFVFLEDRRMDPALLTRLRTSQPRRFPNQVPFLAYLAAKGVDVFDKAVIRPFAEAGIWGANRDHGLLGKTFIVSDDAGQFRVGTHALCRVHAEQLLHKLMPATQQQVAHIETLRELIRLFYKVLKDSSRSPSRRADQALEARFGRIFSIHTGYSDPDKLLSRLKRRKAELLRVLERPISHCTPMRRKEICADLSRSERSLVAPSVETVVRPVTACSV